MDGHPQLGDTFLPVGLLRTDPQCLLDEIHAGCLCEAQTCHPVVRIGIMPPHNVCHGAPTLCPQVREIPNSAAAAVAHWASRAAASHAAVHNHRLARRPPNGYLGRGVIERTVASFFNGGLNSPRRCRGGLVGIYIKSVSPHSVGFLTT